jgi:hypothetical protein
MNRDDALSLLLIVDYVFDWARDVYRPSILRQLKSLAIGKAYDQVSLASDSDIFSLGRNRRNISNWIQPPPSNVDKLDLNERSSNLTPVLVSPGILNHPILNNELGELRSTSLFSSGFSDEDLAVICCVLQPLSSSAFQAASLIHKETPENTVVTKSLIGDHSLSWNIILRLSTTRKDHNGSFYFGRNKQRCDFVISEHKRISNVHFKISVIENGLLILEDLSRNGTKVNGSLLCSKDKEYGGDIDFLHDYSIITVAMTLPEDNYQFIVRIPQRDRESEKMYQKYLTLSSLGLLGMPKMKDGRTATEISDRTL